MLVSDKLRYISDLSSLRHSDNRHIVQATFQWFLPTRSESHSLAAIGNVYVFLVQRYTQLIDLLVQNGVKGFIDQFLKETINPIETAKVDVVIAVPSVYIEYTSRCIQSGIAVAAQNVSATGFGAYTGEIAAQQLKGWITLLMNFI